MKKLLTVFFIIHCFYHIGISQWFWQNPKPQGNHLYSVSFANSQTGWAVGLCGMIIKSIDGGVNWATQMTPVWSKLNSVYFSDAQTGWAVGYYGSILSTTNGGINKISKISSTVPKNFHLNQNYPNPFNPLTNIKYPTTAGLLHSCLREFISIYFQQKTLQKQKR
ncbi:MAG: YCF48-related protein [Ignavibacteria bacterium]|jgi:hypothetical protein